MKFKKVVTWCIPEFALDKDYWKRLDKLAQKRVSLQEGSPLVVKELKDADCLLVWFNSVGKKEIDAAPNLKYIGVLATGYGRIDTKYAKQKGITVCNVPGYSTESVAEFVFAVLLEHLRNLEKAKKQVRVGNYSEKGFSSIEIKDKKFGVIGMGRIGTRVLEIAHGFGAHISYWSRTKKKNTKRSYIDLDKLISTSDILSLHLAKNDQTIGILNAKRIGKIKKDAVVVNTAPMELFDIKALEKRLKKNDLTFILDHADEMNPADVKRLIAYKNCIIYPPIGYVSKEAKKALQEIFLQNIESFLKGKPTNNVN